MPSASVTLSKAEPPPFPDDYAAERRGLAIFLRQTKAFRLALALYNDPANRDAEIRSLRDELAGQGVRVLTLDLRTPDPERTLSGRVRALVDAAGVGPGERLAVMVVNLETQVDYAPELAQPGGPGTAFLETANLHRELFPEACPGPLVVWMTELLERAFVSHSPDLWHWRSHVFDLRTRVVSPELAVSADRNHWSSSDPRRHPEDRVRRLEEELAAYRKIGSVSDEGRILNMIGLARLDAGEFRGALSDFQKARDIAMKLGEKQRLGNALGNLGNVHAALGEARKAIELHEQALSLAHEIGDQYSPGKIWGNLGVAHHDLGQTDEAINAYEQSQKISHENGDSHAVGNALGNLGNVYSELGQARTAIDYYEQSLGVTRKIGDRRGEGNTLGNLGNVYQAAGDVYRAIKLYEQALEIAREVGDRRSEGLALWNAALAFDALDDRVTAISQAEQALSIMEAVEDP